ncbi:unknown protein [Waddlia chondrophila 2032/99]|uniref:Uncharacterized protein n=1 Tax=Waddlia chondrophila 2032/99 TaxID=765953 RepID=F8LAH1_9BACT|nr:unknown protein [Waddlia chondrophila 2032/99]
MMKVSCKNLIYFYYNIINAFFSLLFVYDWL